MKKLSVALIIDLYLMQIFLFAMFFYMGKPITTNYKWPISGYFFVFFLILSVILAVSNIIYSFKFHSRLVADKSTDKTIFRFKLLLIPFFIINFLLWLLFTLALAVPLFMIPFIFVPFGIIYAFMVLSAISLYAISYISHLEKTDILTKKQYLVNAFMQMLFVVDVFNFGYICRKSDTALVEPPTL